jgi:hypothetical protein
MLAEAQVEAQETQFIEGTRISWNLFFSAVTSKIYPLCSCPSVVSSLLSPLSLFDEGQH